MWTSLGAYLVFSLAAILFLISAVALPGCKPLEQVVMTVAWEMRVVLSTAAVRKGEEAGEYTPLSTQTL